MTTDKRKVVLVGTGMVGMSFAYSLVNQGTICNELVLIDLNKVRANGEAMDLNHGIAFAKSNMKIYAGEYSDCKDADIVVIAAGVAQKEGETRLDLLKRNGVIDTLSTSDHRLLKFLGSAVLKEAVLPRFFRIHISVRL